MTQKNEFTKARVEAAFAFCCSEDGTLPRFDTVLQLNIHFIILTIHRITIITALLSLETIVEIVDSQNEYHQFVRVKTKTPRATCL